MDRGMRRDGAVKSAARGEVVNHLLRSHGLFDVVQQFCTQFDARPGPASLG